MTSRRGSTLSHSKREREGESESEYRQEREREQELYYFVTSVVHLDWNQGAPRYLYKNVVVCMKARKDLENAWKLLVINLQYNKLKLSSCEHIMPCDHVGLILNSLLLC